MWYCYSQFTRRKLKTRKNGPELLLPMKTVATPGWKPKVQRDTGLVRTVMKEDFTAGLSALV